jgi:DNA-binding response OmpR family regulator
MKLLVVEDQPDLADNIKRYLSNDDIACDIALGFRQAVDKISDNAYDLFVLDIMLPDGNGLDLLKLIQSSFPEAGVLIISAKNALDDRIKGLNLGADDYLTKPFHLSELNARVRAVFRRRNLNGSSKIVFNEITLDPDTYEVEVNDIKLDLTVKEFDLLMYLISNKNRVLTKKMIVEYLWGEQSDFLPSFDFVYQHIKNLRKKITRAGGNDYIHTIYGLGYKFSSTS